MQQKNNYICYMKIKLSLFPFKDSGKIATIHSGLFKANSKFNTKERWGVEKGRTRWEVCHQYKNEEREKWHRRSWLKSALGVC